MFCIIIIIIISSSSSSSSISHRLREPLSTIPAPPRCDHHPILAAATHNLVIQCPLIIDYTFAPTRPALPYSTTGHGSDVDAAFRRHVASGLHNCSVGQGNSFTIGQPQHDSRHTGHSLNPTRPDHEQSFFLSFFLVLYQQAAAQRTTWRQTKVGLPRVRYGDLAGGTQEIHVNLSGLGDQVWTWTSCIWTLPT